MAGETIVGLHIGTTTIKIVVMQHLSEGSLRIIGASASPILGMKRDVVTDLEEVGKSIVSALELAEHVAGVPVDRAFIDVGGAHLKVTESKGVVAVSRADGEISVDDVSRALGAAETISVPVNREIVYVISKSFAVDGQKHVKDPIGMNGVRLEADTMIVTGSTPTIKNLTKCIFQTGMDIRSVIPVPLAAAKAVLTKRQKDLGVVVVNIGAGTTSIAVFEDGEAIHLSVLPVGAIHITNDIAIGLRTSVDIAEKIKVEFGSALPSEINRRDQIDLSKIDSSENGIIPRRKVAEIIEARMQEIFYLVDKELKKIKHQRLLPAGAVLTGGGSKVPGAVDLAKDVLKLPVQLGFPHDLKGVIDKADDPSFAVPVGLALFASEETSRKGNIFRGMPAPVKLVVGKVKKWIKVFMP